MTLQERFEQSFPLYYLAVLDEDGIPGICPVETGVLGTASERCTERCDTFSSCAECWQQEYEEGGEEDGKKDTG